MSHLPRLLTRRLLATTPNLASTSTSWTRIVCTCHYAQAASSFSTFASSWKAKDVDQRRRGSTNEGEPYTRWTKSLNDTRFRIGLKSTRSTSSPAIRKPFDRSSTSTTAPPRSRSPSGPRSPNPPASTPTTSTPFSSPKDPPLWLKHRQTMRILFPLGWAPPKRLSREAMDLIRTMHSSDPTRYSTRVLSDHFKVSPEAVRRILKSRFTLSTEERERREKKRKEGKVLERIKQAEGEGEGEAEAEGGKELGWRGDLVGEVKEIQELRQKNVVMEAGFEEKRRVKRVEGKATGGGRGMNQDRGASARSATRRSR